MRKFYVFLRFWGYFRLRASDFCDESKVTKSSFRGFAPEYPFILGEQSAPLPSYAAFRFARRRALRLVAAALWTEQASYGAVCGAHPRFAPHRRRRSGILSPTPPQQAQPARTVILSSFTYEALSEAGSAWRKRKSFQNCKSRS